MELRVTHLADSLNDENLATCSQSRLCECVCECVGVGGCVGCVCVCVCVSECVCECVCVCVGGGQLEVKIANKKQENVARSL